MRRVSAVLGSAVFLMLAPGTVVGLVPLWIYRLHHHPARFLDFAGFRVVGVLLIVAGLPVLLESFGRFALLGLGTPAPVFPTRHLVVRGFYRYVRNPMYVAVVAMILGQGLVRNDVGTLVLAVVGWTVTHIFVLTYEEPTLRRTFGAEYENYCAHVPRWVPRLGAFSPAASK